MHGCKGIHKPEKVMNESLGARLGTIFKQYLICFRLNAEYMLLELFVVLDTSQCLEELCLIFLEVEKGRIQWSPEGSYNNVLGHSTKVTRKERVRLWARRTV
jgi:hypothetical protein